MEKDVSPWYAVDLTGRADFSTIVTVRVYADCEGKIHYSLDGHTLLPASVVVRAPYEALSPERDDKAWLEVVSKLLKESL
jgi:hypothetical protein